jgi:AcrR family transcriptional regulator
LSITERKSRHRAERQHRITAAARLIAEREGWPTVTIRRLADEIEYSQPVIYSHFESREAIVAAVAIEGFRELASELQKAARKSEGKSNGRGAAVNVATAYLAFALRHTALYEAMFTLPTSLRFAQADTRSELKAGFAAIAAVVAPFCSNVELTTETFWACLHGLAELERSGRIRRSVRAERVALIVDRLLGS